VRGIAPQQRRLQAFPEIPVKMMVRIQACFCNPDWKEARLPRKSATISIASGNKKRRRLSLRKKPIAVRKALGHRI
jgi:hypothetical protein